MAALVNVGNIKIATLRLHFNAQRLRDSIFPELIFRCFDTFPTNFGHETFKNSITACTARQILKFS